MNYPKWYFYVWTNGECKAISPHVWDKYEGCFIFDPAETRHDLRWGKAIHKRWAEVHMDEIPKEFRLALLIMGVL
jgi:hypothetical protein